MRQMSAWDVVCLGCTELTCKPEKSPLSFSQRTVESLRMPPTSFRGLAVEALGGIKKTA